MKERLEFIKEMESLFPDAFAQIDKYERGLLHCEMGAFRSYIEKKMDEGSEWYCEQAFRFIESCLSQAGPNLENAIEVSFIYDLALGEHNERRYKIVKERMPQSIRAKMVHIREFWK